MRVQATANNYFKILITLIGFLAFPLVSTSATVSLANSPLASSSNTTVQPNIMFILDNSGSMDREHMPDEAGNFDGDYGYKSSHCNGVAYDPTITYTPPIKADKTYYPNASFTGAWYNGYKTSDGTTTLNNSYYYEYTGSVTNKDYVNSGSTFYTECNRSESLSTSVFVKHTLTTSSGATDKQNYANWFSYYRSRLLTMKTAAGAAFSNLGDAYRVGLMKINSSNTPILELGTFDGTHRSDWYSRFYSQTANNSTPLREALSNAGLYYAGKMSSTTDPIQYSCQQNFTILSTDGYWNGNEGFQLDESTAIGNQDDTESRPMFDGTVSIAGYTYTYSRNSYYRQRNNSCSGGRRDIYRQPELGTCFNTSNTSGCTPSNWTDNGGATKVTSCSNSSAPNPSSPVLEGTPVASSSVGGGSSDSLADVAEYYYKTDLRDASLGNCGSASNDLCVNNVFKSSKDTNNQQHMTTFTLGLGANGTMKYSSTYEQDSSGDFYSVKLGLAANSAATPPICPWQTNGTTCNWPLPTNDSPEAIDDLWHAAVNGRGAYFSATNPTSLSDGLSAALVGIDTRKGSAAAAASSTLNPVAGDNMSFIASYVTNEWTGNLEGRGIDTDTGETSLNATWCIEDIPADSCSTSVVAQLVGDTTIYNCEIAATASCSSSGGVVGYSGNLTSGTQYCKIPVATACTGTFSSAKTSPVVSSTTDARTIKTLKFDSSTSAYVLTDFDAAFATANPSYFNSTVLSGLTQWSSLDSTQKANATGENFVKYLRGQYQYENRSSNLTVVSSGSGTTTIDNRLFRARTAIMGDTLESVPTFMGKPVFSYPYAGYSDFKSAQSSRAGTVFIGANDGMLHAFDALTGDERWAYVPSVVIPNMWKLADFDYSNLHLNFVNGTPLVSDICTANCTTTSAVWKTILVGGLNSGGRGYYALDVTNPASPQLLWEFTTTSGAGNIKDDDLGFSFGQPVVTRKSDGTWVVLVTSGYNNVSPGDGKGYLYVLNAGTGAIISKISTGEGSTATPSGLAKIAGNNTETNGNLLGYVYGGDLLGNLWRFDINSTDTAAIGNGAVLKFATLYSDAAGAYPQPITTTPMLAKVSGSLVVYVGTGKYLEVSDLSNSQVQSLYAIKDNGSGATFVNPRASTSLMVKQTLTNNTDINNADTRVVSSPIPVDFYVKRGWYVDFPVSGERINIDGILDAGVIIVPTTIPTSSACTPGGYSFNNFFDYKTGGPTSGAIVSTRYDSLIVGLSRFFIDGKLVNQVVTSDGKIQNEKNLNPPVTSSEFSGKRMLWRELLQ